MKAKKYKCQVHKHDKVRELSVDLNDVVNECTGRVSGFDFFVDSQENPNELSKWVEQELKQNKVKFVKINVSRPQMFEKWMKVFTRNQISNYICYNLRNI